jgi:hypothetical protein
VSRHRDSCLLRRIIGRHLEGVQGLANLGAIRQIGRAVRPQADRLGLPTPRGRIRLRLVRRVARISFLVWKAAG